MLKTGLLDFEFKVGGCNDLIFGGAVMINEFLFLIEIDDLE